MPAVFRAKVAPGIYVSHGRHTRIGLGPPSARVHLGRTGTTFSSNLYAGPVSYHYFSKPHPRWGAPRQRIARPAQSQKAAALNLKTQGEAALAGLAFEAVFAIGSGTYHAIKDEIEQRQADRTQRALALEQFERTLVTAHQAEFPQADEPSDSGPPVVTSHEAKQIRRAMRESRDEGVSRWNFKARGDARRAEKEATADRVAEINDSLARHYEFRVRTWPGLQVDDPETVLEVLEDAFSDNDVPAFAVSCENDHVALVSIFGGPGELPHDTCRRDEVGQAALAKRTDDERRRLFAETVASGVLAIFKEAFAVTVGLAQIDLLAAARVHHALRGDRLSPLCLVTATRDGMQRISDWNQPPLVILSTFEPDLELDEATMEMKPIDLTDHPDAKHILIAIEQELLKQAADREEPKPH